MVPSLPGKAMTRLLPFRADDGIFDPGFIEDRRKGLEAFVNKELVLLSLDYCESVKNVPVSGRLFEHTKRWPVILWLRMRSRFIFSFKKLQSTETIRLAKFEPPNLSSAFFIPKQLLSYYSEL